MKNRLAELNPPADMTVSAGAATDNILLRLETEPFGFFIQFLNVTVKPLVDRTEIVAQAIVNLPLLRRKIVLLSHTSRQTCQLTEHQCVDLHPPPARYCHWLSVALAEYSSYVHCIVRVIVMIAIGA
jgi:hypothetical protein